MSPRKTYNDGASKSENVGRGGETPPRTPLVTPGWSPCVTPKQLPRAPAGTRFGRVWKGTVRRGVLGENPSSLTLRSKPQRKNRPPSLRKRSAEACRYDPRREDHRAGLPEPGHRPRGNP